jgi:predicted AlkP superfamily phosphohydrolase/phosphomutase
LGRPRVAVIGLDGTPASYLRRRIADGGLPHLAELSREGTLAGSWAPLPPISSVSWASASTGVNPGRHGVFGFVERKPGSWDLTFTNALTIAEPQVWARAGAAGLRSVVVNIPGTYPAQPVDGVLVSGFVSPVLEKSVQPPEMVSFLEQRGYLIDVDLSLGHKDLDAFWEQLVAHHAARTRVLVDLLEQEECDLFYVAFTGTDRLHHFLWEQMERGEEPWASRFHDYYDRVDASVGELVSRLPGADECRLILLSDHGFCRIDQEVFVNRWLERDGWLGLTEPATSIGSVVPERTRAYCMDPGRLYLNLAGREPGGIVQPGDYAAVRDELQAWAEGLPFVRRVVTREEAFQGPFAERGPDLVLVSHNGWDLKGAVRTTELQGRGKLTGMHTQDDAFLLVRGAQFDGEGHVQDVAATALDGLGLDASSVDGRVLA